MFANVAGIYVHIPFCRKACHYCNFHFSTSFQHKDELIEAILAEIELQQHYLHQAPIETIYFGGGTPSALPPDDINKIVSQIRAFYPVDVNAEVTLEANPDDMHLANLQKWKESGINRLSIGIQAFQDSLLKEWNRSHTANQAADALELAKKEGFHNLNADLIYGGPGLSDEEWISNIHKLVDAGVPHLSAYALTVEKGTVLANRIQKGKSPSPDDEQSNRQYGMLQEILDKAGYEQYEVSNFAKPGYRSRHNTGYWSGEYYLGIGPSAHSFNGVSRQWNVAHNIKYRHALDHHKLNFEKEDLTIVQRYNELVMTGLRTSEGIDIEQIDKLDSGLLDYLQKEIQPFLTMGKISIKGRRYMLSPAYYFFADGIASELFYANGKTDEVKY